MTSAEIIAALCKAPDFSVTARRVQKAKKLAERMRVDWSDVLAAMTPEQRAQVEGAQ